MRPDTQAILNGLKDFQRETVEHVFRRMYVDEPCTRRFLVADEVGLGKTLVARGLIARTIDHLWEHTDRIDVIYVCSNTDIARQNINRLNVTGRDDFSLSSRITLLPINLPDLLNQKGGRHRINFISFTPGTSFDLKRSGGVARERALLYWMLKDVWSLTSKHATRVFEGTSKRKGFAYALENVREIRDAGGIHTEVMAAFVQEVQQRPALYDEFEGLLKVLPPRREIPHELRRECLSWIGEVRRLLAETCLHWLEPDLIILDEFQRFKYLLAGDSEDASPAAQLAEHLFSYQQDAAEPVTAARVLLLSATPYKMYTLSQESEQDDHYADFQTTLDFLLHETSGRGALRSLLQQYRDELFRMTDGGLGRLSRIRDELQCALRNVIVRTERLALRADRNGMLKEMPAKNVSLQPSDIQDYLALQSVANQLGHHDVLEYWKSSPYLLNFMENYDLKHRFKDAASSGPNGDLAKAVRLLENGMLNSDEIERYRCLDPANARLRSLHGDTVSRGLWQLLWIPPSLPYYQGAGVFADPGLMGFTKRLVFSCWRVVPKAIASVLSYEAERFMMQSFRRRVRNTAESRKRLRGLLRFTFSKGRPTGMPVLAMLYPCRALADRFDPLRLRSDVNSDGKLETLNDALKSIRSELADLLKPIIERTWDESDGVDERWYWAAPLLLDVEYDPDGVRAWFRQENLASIWMDEKHVHDQNTTTRWGDHVEIARDLVNHGIRLGRPPSDLQHVLALMALAAPGTVSLRALNRISPLDDQEGTGAYDLRSNAASLAHSFLHLFNLPEVMYLLRDRRSDDPYWQVVLNYAAAGNIQSVLDEYAHILLESLGLTGADRRTIAAEAGAAISQALTLRTSTAKADIISTRKRRVRIDDDQAIRMRTRFAMRFGDQETEDSDEPTRADHVRAAFNSPFWPFVLATTSVGQEGLDFHPYCHAVVHWNLPSNPVDLEQREGRVHRYKGHALRKNIAAEYSSAVTSISHDPWSAMFDLARENRPDGENDLFPFWVTPQGPAKIERHIPSLPHSKETIQHASLLRSLVLYRMVFGQNRQQDLIDYLTSHLPADEVDHIVAQCRIDLSPPHSIAGSATCLLESTRQ